MARATASERAKRMLAILHLLQPGTELSLDTMADALGISSAELADDLETLSCCGLAPYTPDALVPVLVEDTVALVWGDLPALERAVRLSANQAHAVLAALQAAGLPADDPLCRKLVAATSADATDAERFERVLSSARAEGAQDVLKAASLALANRRVIRLSYQGAGESTPRERVVEPLGLVNERGHWYLEAFVRDAGSLRTFRLDRVRSIDVLPDRAPERALAPSGVAFVTTGLPVARIRLSTNEEVSARDWPGMRVVAQDETGVLIDVPYSGTTWVSRQVLSRLGAAEVLAPAELREAVRCLAEENSASS